MAEFSRALDALGLIPECMNVQDAEKLFSMADKNQTRTCETRYLAEVINNQSGKAAN